MISHHDQRQQEEGEKNGGIGVRGLYQEPLQRQVGGLRHVVVGDDGGDEDGEANGVRLGQVAGVANHNGHLNEGNIKSK
jgi:hypothetical protein